MRTATLVTTTTTTTRTVVSSGVRRGKHSKTKSTSPSIRLNLRPNDLSVESLRCILYNCNASAVGNKPSLVARVRREVRKARSLRAFFELQTCESLKDILHVHNQTLGGNKASLVTRACEVVGQ